ncbi:hypothetical protein NSA19_01140 [Actinomyces bowdenii]|uniref:hypothetical protein n=1 Tax=Actinomyces bowdenii TaxID=131109 RepID=UPI00214AC9FE|nr:hypothetical protein [Actinomyces bowdenii]MCR2051482.1 hypothetical protein [Actinomyces bowdenii]
MDAQQAEKAIEAITNALKDRAEKMNATYAIRRPSLRRIDFRLPDQNMIYSLHITGADDGSEYGAAVFATRTDSEGMMIPNGGGLGAIVDVSAEALAERVARYILK